MLNNLRAEMARKNITMMDLANLLGVRHATISDKINGKYRFYYEEALKIKNTFFPECSLEYLFDSKDKTA